MQIAIQVNLTRAHAYDVTVQVVRELEALGASVLMQQELQPTFGALPVCFLPAEEAWAQCDLFIAIGGDGTFIHAAHDAARYDKEILGINAGNLGFLAGLEKTELPLLRHLIDGDYAIDTRMMLCVEHYRGDALQEKYYCLNDAVFARGLSLRMCDMAVYCEGRHVSDYFTDGLIFATPTGSTAYSLSAGGPVVDPTIETVLLTPICPHSLFSRALLFRPEKTFRVEIKNPDLCLPLLSCDGEDSLHIPPGSTFLIRRANRRSKIIRIKAESFTDILARKMMERRGARGAEGATDEKEQQ